MKKTILIGFVVFAATAFAASNTYKMDLTQNSMVEGKMLKPGNYKVTVENGTAMIKDGKNVIQVPAKEVTDANKVQNTEVTYINQNNIKEVRFGGTHTKIVFADASAMQSGM
jgi:hypothetical protein